MRKENDIVKHLYENILPAGFFKNGFIKKGNRPVDYSYEDYLREYLNASYYFMEKTNGEQFKKPESGESHGEYDANTKDYCIDFKLILGTSMQYVKNKTSSQIIILDGDGVAYVRSKKEGEFKAIWLHRALRGMNYDDVIDYKDKKIEKRGLFETNDVDRLIENDIHDFINSIYKNKNILMLYPVYFECSEEYEVNINDINKAICDDFKYVLRIRELFDKDTYIAFFFKTDFIISKWERDSIYYLESVPVKTSKTFKWIADFYGLDPIVRKLYS